MNKFNRPVETILIADGNASVVSDGATALVATTGVVNLSDGQLGVFDAGGMGTNSNYTAINVGDTVAESPAIVIAQGTPYSATPGVSNYAGLYKRGYEVSHRIYGKNVTVWSGKAYIAPRQSAWVIGADEANSDAIGTPLDSTEYGVRVTLRGRRREDLNGNHQRETHVFTYVTPSYTDDATITNPLDHMVQNLVSNINKHSRAISTDGNFGKLPLVAFAIRHEGSSGIPGAVLASALDSLDGGVATGYGFSTDAETAASNNNSAMGAAFVALIADTNADVDTSTEVIPINLTTAGTNASGANGIIIMALDEQVAYDDRLPELKVKLEVAKAYGFGSAVGCYESSGVKEGGWTPEQLRKFYADTVGQRGYSQNRSVIPVVEIPDIDDYLDTTSIYDVYIIESIDTTSHPVGGENRHPQRCYIFVDSNDTTTKNSLEAVLNPYLESAGLLAVNI